ncbi:divalent-cation tolerance protein CutA [Salidesulfovibrio brasiliensis]|uniref:divalent-cation tolerance protein CutA n=1 Tax=Salidesulfovibrio brasiliensis TaxID=221711 RepID=UPI0006CF83C1|nr:divalent-cation tolerance protein CutA [Salidesulfovibrio brasiliensis]
MSQSLVYITAGDMEEAERIGAALVEDNLAACVNIIPGMKSMYRWEGKVESSQEVVVIAKTRSDLVQRLTLRVADVHSYEVPCVAAVPIQGGNQAFLQWITEETS